MPTTKGEPAGIKPASFKRRLLTSAIYGVVMLTCLMLGNTLLALPLLTVVFAALGVREFYRIASPNMAKVPRLIGFTLAVSLPVITTIAGRLLEASPILGAGGLGGLTALLYSTLIALLAYLFWVAVTPTARIQDAAVGFFGGLYLGIPLSCLLLIREMNDANPLLAVALVVSIAAADSFAYLGGSLLGRHKLAPVISPKKSWEGLIAGTLGAILFWYVVPRLFTGSASIIAALLMGIIVSITSLLGDLFESRIKRDAGVKDSGTLLPGHGGILDRIDSLLFTAPAMFLLLSTVGVALGVVTI